MTTSEMTREILKRYPKATGFMCPCVFNGKIEILFYPTTRSVDPYSAIYDSRSDEFYILREF